MISHFGSTALPAASRALAAAALAFAALVALAGAACAQSPSEDEMQRLRGSLARASSVRVRTPIDAWVEKRVSIAPEGVGLPGAAQFGANETRPLLPAMVPWERVVGIDVRRGNGDRGVIYGALFGAAVGLMWAMAPHDQQTLGGSTARPLFVLCGAGAGAGFGAMVGGGLDAWAPVWPEPR